MFKDVKTDEFKIVEVKEGVYVENYYDTSFSQYRFQLTKDIEKAMRFDIYDKGIRDIARHSFGSIRKLRVSYTIGDDLFYKGKII